MGGSDRTVMPTPPDDRMDCRSVVHEVTLVSPNPEELQVLGLEDELTIESRRKNGVTSLVAVSENGSVVGSITSMRFRAKVLRCLEQGFEFVGVVVELLEGHCRIKVYTVD